MKATAIAPSNIAFIKYWGKKDEILRLPENGSISMNLSGLLTTTTVEFSPKYTNDLVSIDDKSISKEVNRVTAHLDRIRSCADIVHKARVVSKNNFPSQTGLSSSASGMAALTVAGTAAAGLHLSEKELSILARQGSGSACRSIPDGYVEWLSGDSSETSYAQSLYPETYWDICDLVAVVSSEKKEISSTQGQTSARTSEFYEKRISHMNARIQEIKKYMKQKNFQAFGELVEAEAFELHAVMLTSRPALVYLQPNSILLLRMVQIWRKEGLPVYATLNTGQDVHLIVETQFADKLIAKLSKIPEVKRIIKNNTSKGAHIISQHLF